jgi:ubiquinone/menaquinone biosynthesis C-methylase UbiE
VPFFGIDRDSPTPLDRIEDLAARGIFRKYEHVLDLGGGLGATTRYLTSRLGCTATVTASCTAEAAAGRTLTERAGLDWQVFHVAAEATRLPCATAAFTHVWIIESLSRLGPVARVLGEAFRVLRPGGHCGVQELVARRPHRDGFVDADVRRSDLERAGFLEVETRHVEFGVAPGAAQGDAAWGHLTKRLGATNLHVEARRRIREGLSSGALGLVQLTARRP